MIQNLEIITQEATLKKQYGGTRLGCIVLPWTSGQCLDSPYWWIQEFKVYSPLNIQL